MNELASIIRKYDIAMVPLATTIYGAVPSKIFELMQLGIPILYVGGGEALKIVETNNIGLSSFPKDYEKLTKNIITFKEMTPNQYALFVKNSLQSHKNEYNLNLQGNALSHFID